MIGCRSCCGGFVAPTRKRHPTPFALPFVAELERLNKLEFAARSHQSQTRWSRSQPNESLALIDDNGLSGSLPRGYIINIFDCDLLAHSEIGESLI